MKRVISSLAVVSLLSTAVFAHHGGDKRGGFKRGPVGTFFQLTDLTDDQSDTIKTALQSEKELIRTLHDERRDSNEIVNLISENGLDRESFLTAESQFSTKMAEIKADTLETILANLTPEQITEYLELSVAE
jgi:Spy/CpxP family protein refolding chaperone